MRSSLRATCRGQAGFTLIELLLSLVLVGILVSLGGMGVVSIIQGYVFTRLNAATAQKAQVALSRLDRELIHGSAVTSGTGTSITFECVKEGGTVTRTVSWSGVAGEPLYLGGDILVDGARSFNLGYYDAPDGAKQSTWTAGSSRLIEVSLVMSAADGGDLTFTTRVIPRDL